MIKDLIKKIIDDNDLNELQKDFLTKMYSIAYNWKELNSILLFMPISEKTEIKIRKILNSIGEEMIKICDLMIKEKQK